MSMAKKVAVCATFVLTAMPVLAANPLDLFKNSESYSAAVVSVTSYHFGWDKEYFKDHIKLRANGRSVDDYNQSNPGIGFEWGRELPSHNQVYLHSMIYKDSYYNSNANFSGIGYRMNYDFNPYNFNVRLAIGIKGGYLRGSGTNGFVAIPTFSIGHKNINLDMVFAPKSDKTPEAANVFGFCLRYTFGGNANTPKVEAHDQSASFGM